MANTVKDSKALNQIAVDASWLHSHIKQRLQEIIEEMEGVDDVKERRRLEIKEQNFIKLLQAQQKINLDSVNYVDLAGDVARLRDEVNAREK